MSEKYEFIGAEYANVPAGKAGDAPAIVAIQPEVMAVRWRAGATVRL